MVICFLSSWLYIHFKCEAPDFTLQDLLKLRENEVDFVNTLRSHIESTRKLKLQVKHLQKRLEEKEQKLKEANEVIRQSSTQA